MKVLSPGKLSVIAELVTAKRHFKTRYYENLTGNLFRFRNLLIALPEDPHNITAILKSVPDYLFLPGELKKIDPSPL